MGKCLQIRATLCSGRTVNDVCNKHYLQLRRHGKISVSNRDARKAIVQGDIVKIPLGLEAKDGYAIVDKKYAYLAKDNWRKSHFGYAIRSKDKKLLHRVISEASNGGVVDHINGNKLDNRMINIRVCSQSDNSKNQKVRKNTRTGYKGVTLHKNKYRARVKADYVQYELGWFDSAEKAARAYNTAAVRLHGEFARLNHGV